MKLAFHGATSMKSDLRTDIAVTAATGYDGLEVWAAKADAYLTDHSLASLRRLFRDSGIEPISINSIEFIGFRGPEYAEVQQRCRDLCAMAEGIGCRTLVVVPSPIPVSYQGKARQLFFPWEEVVREYVAVLRDMSEIARPHGVRLAFEFLGFAWCTVRTPRGAQEIVTAAGCDNVGINFDACHFYGGGGELGEIDALDASTVYTFHLNDMEAIPKEAMSDSRRLLPGDGVIPLYDICSRLSRIGYDGACSIELFRPEYWDWDPQELAAKAHQAAVRVLSPHFQLE